MLVTAEKSLCFILIAVARRRSSFPFLHTFLARLSLSCSLRYFPILLGPSMTSPGSALDQDAKHARRGADQDGDNSFNVPAAARVTLSKAVPVFSNKRRQSEGDGIVVEVCSSGGSASRKIRHGDMDLDVHASPSKKQKHEKRDGAAHKSAKAPYSSDSGPPSSSRPGTRTTSASLAMNCRVTSPLI